MDNQISRQEVVKLFDELKCFVMDSLNRLEQNNKESAQRIETKIDIATDNINKYAKDTIEHAVKIQSLERDTNSLGDKVRILQRWHWVTTGGIAVIVFVVNYFK
jgi:polyhydroxyalkanoate synthesis regulator phasin